ncbi:Fis family transcriptional regulator [Sorangium cellulosum]|uniref:Fis family transcriptional regulator n=1 Tax=Sorangium cellulosum TaxID=56 RepID=A0A150PEM4_SORCE|nr:Fis family transcriptional regulator [Sorangium cellulosum]
MSFHASLLDIARLLLSEDDGESAPRELFRQVLEATSAEHGFIVVREGDEYVEKFDIDYERAELSSLDRRFSRSVVRLALASREVIHAADLLSDARFSQIESIQALGARAVLAAPLTHGDEVYGVIYLEQRRAVIGFSDDALRFVTDVARMAGAFLRRALEREALRRRTRSLERDLFARYDFEGIITQDPRMLGLLRDVAQVADTDATVLIRGETGTGKELVARALHVNSARSKRPFVVLHTSALPATLLESELFGHVKGAFSGADRDRAGRIASADGGTLFLDEVAEIAPEVQAKLLRFLQFGEIQRLGSDRTQKVDVRVLAATHQDLGELVKAGRFRQDLYFRLKVIELFLPPLRERSGDVPLLLGHFVRHHGRRRGEQPRFTPRARRALLEHGYPGNVRELSHLVERACLLATGPEMDVDLLPGELLSAARSEASPAARFAEFTAEELAAAREAAVAEVERSFIDGLMARHGGNVSQAARASGIHRSYLQKLLARHRKEPA